MSKRYILQRDINSPIGSAKAGTIGEDDGFGRIWFGSQYWDKKTCDAHKDWFLPEQPEVENKEWEVVCFTDGKRNWWRKSDGLYCSYLFEPGLSEMFLLGSSDKKIHSVKRIRDAEVFTVGDETNKGSINHFAIVGERRTLLVDCGKEENRGAWSISDVHKSVKPESKDVFTTDDKIALANEIINDYEKYGNLSANTYYHMRDIVKKSKQPIKPEANNGKDFLFISDDGVRIYEGDRVTWVLRSTNEINEIYSGSPLCPPHFTFPKRDCKPSDTWAMFSTKEAAYEFIVKNKKPDTKEERIEVVTEDNEQWVKLPLAAFDEAIQKAFEAARLHHPLAGLKFDNAIDYINSLNTNSKTSKHWT